MNYREWLRTASEDDIAEILCEIQGRGGCGGCVGVNYTGSDGTCSGKPGEAVRKWLQAKKEPSAQLAKDTNVPSNDLISRKAAIDALRKGLPGGCSGKAEYIIGKQPAVQPEQPTGVQDILQYLDEYLHPIVSPEHWSVYSELHDMVSMLPTAQPETSRIEQELHGKTPEEQYEFLYWLLLRFALAYTDSRLAVVEWLRGEKEYERHDQQTGGD